MKVFKIVSGSILLVIFITINIIELGMIGNLKERVNELEEFKEKQVELNNSNLNMFNAIIEFEEAQIKINDYLIGSNFNVS